MSVLGAATTAINNNPSIELGAFVSVVSIFTGVILKVVNDSFAVIKENTEMVTHHRDGIDDLTQAIHENTRVVREMKIAFELSEKYNQVKESRLAGEKVGEAGPTE